MTRRGRRDADEALALGLAAGKTVRDAARDAGVSEKTAFRRSADGGFRDRVNELRGEMRQRTVGRLADLSVQAVATLSELLAPGPPPAVRLNAAKAILEHMVRVWETVELQQRIAALEAERREPHAPIFASQN